MKYILPFFVLMILFAPTSEAQTPKRGHAVGGNPRSHAVRSYVRKDGTRVTAHQATNPNKTKSDNYKTK